ncbi:MAG TPA: nuclear transport factor 2 family protein [Candidatus Limnocylindrales bacterium]|nr:nuclear transport factor 2 family protein [Candidatus Limnocylindrales bacterium]
MDDEMLFEVPENDAHRLRKEAAVKFLSLIAAGKPKDGLVFFSADCVTHNPYVAGGMDALTDAMIAVQKRGSTGIVKGASTDFKLSIRQVLAEGDFVAAHTTLSGSNPAAGGLRQIHLFRFKGDKIVEYWDITQFIPEAAPNAEAAFT